MNQLKILHVTQGYWPAIGGTEWLMQRLSEELVRQFNDEVTVFTTNCYSGESFWSPNMPRMKTGQDEINGVKIHRFPVYSHLSRALGPIQKFAFSLGLPFNDYLRTYYSGPIIPGLVSRIQAFPADIIAASSFPLLHMYNAQKAGQKSKRPVVFFGGLHPVEKWGFGRPNIYKAIKKASYYIAYTGFEAQYVINKGAQPEKVAVIGLGVDPQPFQNISVEDAKRRYGLEGKKVVGFIGQIGGHKGVDTLIKAMPQVWEQCADTYVLIAGSRTLFCDNLEKMISEWPEEFQKKIILHYNFGIEEKPWLFSAVDIFVYPSGFESFGISFLEAWAASKPVIGCRVGAIPWVVQAGLDGFLIEYQNPAMLSEAISILLKNPTLAHEMGEVGQRKVISQYTWPKVAANFRKIYLSAINASK